MHFPCFYCKYMLIDYCDTVVFAQIKVHVLHVQKCLNVACCVRNHKNTHVKPVLSLLACYQRIT